MNGYNIFNKKQLNHLSEFGFLKHHQYPINLIEKLESEKNNLAHIRYDIGLDFEVEEKHVTIKKTSFFGTF